VVTAGAVELKGALDDLRGASRGAGPAGGAPADPNRRGPRRDDTFEFRVDNKPLKEVLMWLSDQTGLPFIGSSVPGSFTFVGPEGQRYTVPEIVAIINRSLRLRGLELVRRERCFVIVHVD
jgi:hypothetical protein